MPTLTSVPINETMLTMREIMETTSAEVTKADDFISQILDVAKLAG